MSPTDITDLAEEVRDTQPAASEADNPEPINTVPQLIVLDAGEAPVCTDGACL